MMYASRAIVSYDPTCPRVFEGNNNQIYIPFDFNVSVCPFCGNKARADMPSMFYSPKRNQVIYNCPQLGQYTKTEALEIHRSTIASLRKMYKTRIEGDKAMQFERASEELTYNIIEFLYAVQMGTTGKEEHVSLLISSLSTGLGFIFDPTKGFCIMLTQAEMLSPWVMDNASSVDDADIRPLVKDAIEAFAAGQYEQSRYILESLHKEHPKDEWVRKNLAVAYVTLGDKESARSVLRG